MTKYSTESTTCDKCYGYGYLEPPAHWHPDAGKPVCDKCDGYGKVYK